MQKIRSRSRVRFPYMSLGSVSIFLLLVSPMSIAGLELEALTLDSKHENNSRLIVLT